MSSPSSNTSTNPPHHHLDTPTLTNALSHLSARLLQKTKSHHTFVVTGDVVFTLFFRSKEITSSVELLQTSTLLPKEKEIMISAVLRASEKFNIREDWVNNGGERELDPEYIAQVMERSLTQKEIVYSGDGMTLLAADFLYELRKLLSRYSKSEEEGGGEDNDLWSMVEVLRRLVAVENKGRSLRRETLEEFYPKLEFSDDAWDILKEEYERRFGEKGLRGNDEISEDDEIELLESGDEGSIHTEAS